jgi:hypothetical protein
LYIISSGRTTPRDIGHGAAAIRHTPVTVRPTSLAAPPCASGRAVPDTTQIRDAGGLEDCRAVGALTLPFPIRRSTASTSHSKKCAEIAPNGAWMPPFSDGRKLGRTVK